jgi:MFS transporter, NNP family, nitrate/nitrite transporter
MYWTFGVSVVCTFLLSYPSTDYVVHGIEGPIAFTIHMGLVPFVDPGLRAGLLHVARQGRGLQAHPRLLPEHVGSVGGLVGMIGGLGGFILPIAFGAMNDLTGIWTSCFMLLFLLVLIALHGCTSPSAHGARAARAGAGYAARVPELAHVRMPSTIHSSPGGRRQAAEEAGDLPRMPPRVAVARRASRARVATDTED